MGRLDELKQQVSYEQLATFYDTPLPATRQAGNEVRMACFLNCGKSEPTGDRAIAINTSTPDARWKCHQYGCTRKGDLVTLAHLLKAGFDGSENPRGDRFKAILADLEAIANGAVRNPGKEANRRSHTGDSAESSTESKVNIPLKDSPKEAARKLVDLHEKFVTDPDVMPPKAASYFRHRPWLTSEVASQWRMGYLPRDAGGDRSGGTMRGKIVYEWPDARGDTLTYFGRNPDYEDEYQRWLQAHRAGAEPVKTRFVKGFQRGLEWFGQHVDLCAFREQLRDTGLLLVEGPNDVMRLRTLGDIAWAACSNHVTEEQVQKAIVAATEHARNRVTLLFDRDDGGRDGVKQALWRFSFHDVDTRVIHLPEGTEQPENLTKDLWGEIRARIACR